MKCFYAYSFSFNGKEKDDETYGGGNEYDFGARIYNSRLGQFLSIDPLTKKYPYWSPYLFAGNNPIRFIDINGEGPGDLFKNINEAAVDFGMNYNDNSIKYEKEYGALIFKVRRHGEIYYTYNIPTRSEDYNSVDISRKGKPFFRKVLADIHTHSSFDLHSDNDFSDMDKRIARGEFFPMRMFKRTAFVSTPSGTLLKYDPNKKTTILINDKLPSDPKDPCNNGNDYNNSPKRDEPTQKPPKHLIGQVENKIADVDKPTNDNSSINQ